MTESRKGERINRRCIKGILVYLGDLNTEVSSNMYDTLIGREELGWSWDIKEYRGGCKFVFHLDGIDYNAVFNQFHCSISFQLQLTIEGVERRRAFEIPYKGTKDAVYKAMKQVYDELIVNNA